jgi:hypothetical protein
VKSKCDELSQALERLQGNLDSVRHERKRALGERDEAHQESVT